MTLEVMGLLVGKPEGNTIVVMDAVPLPIKGEANFVEAGSEIATLQIQLMESLESRRKENFIGWVKFYLPSIDEIHAISA